MKDKFTIIIPTMYRAPYELSKMIEIYDRCNLIHEIILVHNDHKRWKTQKSLGRINLSASDKISIVGYGENNFVNPSWNMAVEVVQTDNIIIANDDILIEESELRGILEIIKPQLKPSIVIGPVKGCFFDGVPDKYYLHKGSQEITYGYGTFMIMKKESYNPVPSELKVWYGDNWQLLNKEQWYFDGIRIHTQMRTTSKTLNLKGQNTKEKAFFNAKLKELKHEQYKGA